jgi:beta-lactamase regulating signal transducer with metallopeptidase domain
MSTLETLWFRLIPLTVSMAIAALVVQALIWILRPISPQTHRIAWACALISGISFARIPINVPDRRLDLIGAPQANAIVETLANPAPQTDTLMSGPRASTPGPSSAPVSPAPEDRVRVPQLGGRIESEVSAVPTAALLPRLQSAWRQIALFAWGFGTAVLLGMGVLSYIRFARCVGRIEPASGEWAREWHALLRERRVGRQVPLVVSESWGPALCLLPAGYRVIVPKSLWSALSATERTAILRHELAHYERGDLFKSLFGCLIVALHWFNPCAWWARRQFEAAGEWACDDAAAHPCGAIEFAKTLMQLAGIHFPAIPLTDAVGTGGLYARVRRLLTASSAADARWKKNVVAVVSMGIIALASIRVSRVAEATSPPTNRIIV